MASIAQLAAALQDIKNTPSSKVEYNANSLETVMGLIEDLLEARGVLSIASVAGLSGISGTETQLVLVRRVGLFEHSTSGTPTPPDSYPAAGGGIWVKQLAYTPYVDSLSDLSDVNIAGLANLDSLFFNTSTNKWENGASLPVVISNPEQFQEIRYNQGIGKFMNFSPSFVTVNQGDYFNNYYEASYSDDTIIMNIGDPGGVFLPIYGVPIGKTFNIVVEAGDEVLVAAGNISSYVNIGTIDSFFPVSKTNANYRMTVQWDGSVYRIIGGW